MIRERYLVHIGGSPGSGKSRMARRLVEQLTQQSSLSAEHISLGDRLRMIHRGEAVLWSFYAEYIRDHLDNQKTAASPLPDEIVANVVSDALVTSDEKEIDVVLLDGFPRNISQVTDYFHQAMLSNRQVPGVMIAQTTTTTALERMIRRGNRHADRATTIEAAHDKLRRYSQAYPVVLEEFQRLQPQEFSIETIDTSGPRQQTDHLAYQALQRILALGHLDTQAS